MGLVFGKAFLGAYAPLVILMMVPFLGIFSFPLGPMLYALGRSDAPLKAKLIGTAVFLGTIAPLSWRFGVLGAAVALVFGNAANVVALMLQLAANTAGYATEVRSYRGSGCCSAIAARRQ